MLARIDHVAIVVRDIDEASQAFVDLGLRVVHDEHLEGIGVRLVFLLPRNGDEGHTTIQLVEPTGHPEIQAFLEDHGQGLHHVCFAVESIPAVLSTLDGEGQTEIFMGSKGRVACFLARKWSGTTIELTELEQRDPEDAQALIASSRHPVSHSVRDDRPLPVEEIEN